MVSEGADKPRQVTVGLGHVVTIHPDVDGRTGHRILSNYYLLLFAQSYNTRVQLVSTVSCLAFVLTGDARLCLSPPHPVIRCLK